VTTRTLRVGFFGQTEHSLRPDPAPDVLPIAEDQHQRPASRGVRQAQGSKGGIVERGREPSLGGFDNLMGALATISRVTFAWIRSENVSSENAS